MKIENGTNSVTIDELIDYAFEHSGKEIIEAVNKKDEQILADSVKNSDWNDDDGHLWKRISESIEKSFKEKGKSGIKIGEIIKERREKCGYTVEQVAEAANILPLTLKAIEKGKAFLPPQTTLTIIKFLRETPENVLKDIEKLELQSTYDRVMKKLEGLTLSQLKTVEDILDAYIKNL